MLRRADDTLRVALVTGACSGIGLEMARLLGAFAAAAPEVVDESAGSVRGRPDRTFGGRSYGFTRI